MAITSEAIGRAKTALVFGQEDSAKAVISTVIVHLRQDSQDPRLHFVGSVTFEASTFQHINDILLPIVDRILTSLNLAQKNFEISAVNLGAASSCDLGVKVSGLSADAPLLLALLSAGLDLAIPDDVISTGHIASCDGDIAAVKALPAKIAATISDGSLHRFICPVLDRDRSLESLSPAARERASDAIVAAKGKLQVTPVGNIAELTRAVFTDQAVVLASLTQGFFDASGMEDIDEGPLAQILSFLTENNEGRFWRVLEHHLLSDRSDGAKRLLNARVQFHRQRKTYPKGMGRALLQLLRSLPPTTRQVKTTFPLLSMNDCIALSQFAAESDHDDVRLLYDASFGKGISQPATGGTTKLRSKKTKLEKAGADLDNVLSEIDSESLTQKISLPIDAARASYLLDSVTLDSHEQFYDTITAFYLHLLRHSEQVMEPANMAATRAGALNLVERTFAGKGGLDAALAEARDAIHGGMRFILDALTEQFKTEVQVNYVNQVLKQALNPLDWKAKVAFMSALLERIEPFVSAEIRSIPPERLARNYETVVKTYVKSFDKVKELLRTL